MDSINNGPKFGGDAWLELQAFKTRQINRREKLNRHKDLLNGITSDQNASIANSSSLAISYHTSSFSRSAPNNSSTSQSVTINSATPSTNNEFCNHENDSLAYDQAYHRHTTTSTDSSCPYKHDCHLQSEDCILWHIHSKDIDCSKSQPDNDSTNPIIGDKIYRPFDINAVECLLLLKLCDVAMKLPIDSKSLLRSICKLRGFERTTPATVENLLEKFAHQELISIEAPSAALLNRNKKQLGAQDQDDELCIYVISADHTKLVEFNKAFDSSNNLKSLLLDGSRDEATEETELSSRDPPLTAQRITETLYAQDVDSKNPFAIQKCNRNESEHLRLSRKILASDGAKKIIIPGDDVESLLSLSSTRERESKKLGEELLELLSKPTAKERNLLERFRSADGYQVQEFCAKGTKGECRRNSKGTQACDKLHFKKIIAKHTDESLGDCSFLNTCFHMDSCKYVHYEVDYDDGKAPHPNTNIKRQNSSNKNKHKERNYMNSADKMGLGRNLASSKKLPAKSNKQAIKVNPPKEGTSKVVSKYALSAEEQARIEIRNRKRFKTVLHPPQWIQCDLRYFDMSLLGKFSVVMADPPWDIHMELPYGTMSDDEMRKLNIPALQDEGVIFLWVTGRAMELGRECLALWGYERCDEIIWVKTNQLQRIIRTGRTGHWLNHGKEHCLVGIKGSPKEMNRGLDCDIIVAEVRATSHKPDEIYGIIERLSPGTRKIELFGRAHNVQPNWITLGNQLDGVRLVEPSLIEAFKTLNLPYQTTE